MWWNILPSWIITGALFVSPVPITKALAYVYFGCTEGRGMTSQYHYYNIFRDKRLLPEGECPMRQHKHLGLDGIPDD